MGKTESKLPIRIIVLGKTGGGKSTFCNYLAGRKIFKEYYHLASGTKRCKLKKVDINGYEFQLIDTPGLFDTEHPELVFNQIMSFLQNLKDGINFGFICHPIHDQRLYSNVQERLGLYKALMGAEAFAHTAILLTKIDELDKGVANKKRKNFEREYLNECKKHNITGLYKKILHYKNEDKGKGRDKLIQFLIDRKRINNPLNEELERAGKEGVIKENDNPDVAQKKIMEYSPAFDNLVQELNVSKSRSTKRKLIDEGMPGGLALLCAYAIEGGVTASLGAAVGITTIGRFAATFGSAITIGGVMGILIQKTLVYTLEKILRKK